MQFPACVSVRNFIHRQAETERRKQEKTARPSGHAVIPPEPDEDYSREAAEVDEEARARVMREVCSSSSPFKYFR